MKESLSDIELIKKQLSETCNDPDLAMLECHCFNLDEGKLSDEDWHKRCNECSVYIDFAKRNPNHFPNHLKYKK